MESRDLFNAAASCEKTTRPPLWVMRQAGRYLPEYRELKSKHGFLEIVKTPELSLEAALQPMRRFDFDCSILFSDILVISEALGFPYKFRDTGGIALERFIKNPGDIVNMPPAEIVREKLGYVTDALRLLRRALPNKAVIGFCGAPFTLAAYMIEGGSNPGFPKYLQFIKEHPEAFEALMQKLSETLSEYATMQAECGIDAFQIFDSHAALTPSGQYANMSGKFISGILKSIRGRARSIVFANGMSARFNEVTPTGADVYSIESGATLSEIKKNLPAQCALQGNLDPALLSNATPLEVKTASLKILNDMSKIGGHIFNLGHGILPDAKIENVEALCETVKNFKA